MPVNQTNSTEAMSTTTEKYRISRKELGYILGRNYRGLRKLFRIELNDALNVMKISNDASDYEAGCDRIYFSFSQLIYAVFFLLFLLLQQSKYNIKEYKNELGVSLARYTIPKELPPTTTTEADN